jgi:hypothetical protein
MPWHCLYIKILTGKKRGWHDDDKQYSNQQGIVAMSTYYYYYYYYYYFKDTAMRRRCGGKNENNENLRFFALPALWRRRPLQEQKILFSTIQPKRASMAKNKSTFSADCVI